MRRHILKKHLLGLRSRFIIFVLAGVSIVSASMAWITYQDTKEALLEVQQERLFELAKGQATEIARRLALVSGPVQAIANVLEVYRPQNRQELSRLLRREVSDSPNIYGMAAAYAPYEFDPSKKFFSSYVFRSSKGVQTMDLDSEDFNYPRWDWYLIPYLLAKPVWSEPYFDEGAGNVFMTTFSAPMVIGGQVQGVVTGDVALDKLGKEVARMAVGREGWSFLITSQGAFLAAPDPSWIMRETIFSLAEERNWPELRTLGRRMLRGAAGVVDTTNWISEGKSWMAYHPVEGLGWSLGVVIPESEVFEPIVEMAKREAITAGLGLIAMMIVVWLLVMGLTRPITILVAGARRLASGDMTTRVEGVLEGDELGEMASAFNTMVEELNRYVEELTSTTAAKERIESELDLANQIQQSILPRIYPAFPDRPEFDLYAKNIPARMVGGDFYDFFFVDEGRLGMVVGDVSGKGIPAALFMTVSSTLIKNSAQHHMDPIKVLQEVNGMIEPGNEMCMFVTIFYGVYDIATGRLVYASGGHPAPLLRKANGEVAQIPEVKGAAVGVMPILNLEQGEITLEPEDILLVFTDGLDEAVDAHDNMFGIPRAAQWLKQAEVTDGPTMIQDLEKFQLDFTGPVEPFDDLTLLIFRRKE